MASEIIIRNFKVIFKFLSKLELYIRIVKKFGNILQENVCIYIENQKYQNDFVWKLDISENKGQVGQTNLMV